MGRGDLSNAEWERLRPLLPPETGRRGGRWRDHRQMINGIIWRTRTGAPWRDLPERYGPWQTCYKRFARFQIDGTWVRIQQAVQRDAGELDWQVQADSSVVRAHQHAAGAPKGAHLAGVGRAVEIGPLPRRPVDQDPCAGGWTRPAAGDPYHARPSGGYYRAAGLGGCGPGAAVRWGRPAAGAPRPSGG
jgi:transposase